MFNYLCVGVSYISSLTIGYSYYYVLYPQHYFLLFGYLLFSFIKELIHYLLPVSMCFISSMVIMVYVVIYVQHMPSVCNTSFGGGGGG